MHIDSWACLQKPEFDQSVITLSFQRTRLDSEKVHFLFLWINRGLWWEKKSLGFSYSLCITARHAVYFGNWNTIQGYENTMNTRGGEGVGWCIMVSKKTLNHFYRWVKQPTYPCLKRSEYLLNRYDLTAVYQYSNHNMTGNTNSGLYPLYPSWGIELRCSERLWSRPHRLMSSNCKMRHIVKF